MTHQYAAPQAGSGSERQPADQRPGSLETLELRWFAPDRIPAAAIRWFENAAPQVLFEERTDSYLITGRDDLGVKRRDNGPLEIKERHGVGHRMSVGDRLVGRVEEWHKRTSDRSPAEGDRWVKVAKTVRTYPYRATGSSVEARCDIELAAVEIDGMDAWTLAFEASGPERMVTLEAAVEHLLFDEGVPADIAASLELEAGYPAWLVVVTGT